MHTASLETAGLTESASASIHASSASRVPAAYPLNMRTCSTRHRPYSGRLIFPLRTPGFDAPMGLSNLQESRSPVRGKRIRRKPSLRHVGREL